MMQSSYTPVFCADVLHSYFSEGICTCLRFIPSAATQPVLNRFGFRMQGKTNGFTLFTSSPGPLSSLLSYITRVTGETAFSFDIISRNDGFPVFTEMPADRLVLLTFDSSNSSGTAPGNIVSLVTVFTDVGEASVTGTLTLNFSDILNYINGNSYGLFRISLTARSTQWQYYVVNRNAMQLDNPSVTEKGGMTLEGPQPATTPAGEQALLFTSGSTLLPLSEIPVYRFDLVNTPSNGAAQKKSSPKVVFRGLPNPGASNTAANAAGSSSLVTSPMYVYV
ncbi:MAG TPA: hypothetical protein VFU15_17615 [Bacteroidia bacterium]|nr:hypothetical protein [Bacteroidia bacterium]